MTAALRHKDAVMDPKPYDPKAEAVHVASVLGLTEPAALLMLEHYLATAHYAGERAGMDRMAKALRSVA